MEHPLGKRLLESALDHFGRSGLEGANTRMIARDADTLMSSITYHFGGKEQLYLAVADHVAVQLAEHLRPMAARVEAVLAAGPSPAVIRGILHTVMTTMIDVMVNPQTTGLARFIVREQADPTEAFSRIYEGAMRPMLDRLGPMLIVVAHGRLTERQARIRALTLVGQVLMFRVARATVLRGTGWADIGPTEAAEIKAAIADNLDAILDQLEGPDR